MSNFHALDGYRWRRWVSTLLHTLFSSQSRSATKRINTLDLETLPVEQMRDLGLLENEVLRREQTSTAVEAARDLFMRRSL